jgi:hypothetical protein
MSADAHRSPLMLLSFSFISVNHWSSRKSASPAELAWRPLMKKNDWKVLIDALLFVDLCSIAVIGLLLAFVIPTGKTPEASKFLLGLHRHQWGDIHLYLSLMLLGLLILHVWLNWTWVVQSAKSYVGESWRKYLWMLCWAWIPVLFAAWVLMML